MAAESVGGDLTQEQSMVMMGQEEPEQDAYGAPAIQRVTKQNNILPIWKNTETMNLNHLVLENIRMSPYFKQHLFTLKTYHEVIDELYYNVSHLEPWERGTYKASGQTGMCGGVRGVGAGGVVSTPFCILFKLFTMKLTRKQLVGMINHSDSPYIRGLGFMYVRFCQPPETFWDWLEPYFDDDEEIDPKAGGGEPMTMGQLVKSLLCKLDWYGTLFPRIPVPIQKEIDRKLREYNEKKMEEEKRQWNEEQEEEKKNQDRPRSSDRSPRRDRREHEDRSPRRERRERERERDSERREGSKRRSRSRSEKSGSRSKHSRHGSSSRSHHSHRRRHRRHRSKSSDQTKSETTDRKSPKKSDSSRPRTSDSKEHGSSSGHSHRRHKHHRRHRHGHRSRHEKRKEDNEDGGDVASTKGDEKEQGTSVDVGEVEKKVDKDEEMREEGELVE